MEDIVPGDDTNDLVVPCLHKLFCFPNEFHIQAEGLHHNMQKEFFFSPPHGTIFDLGVVDFATSANEANQSYLVSNIQMPNAEIYAPEINFYLRTSKASIENKINNVKRLFEARVIAFDLTQQTEMTIEVGRRVLVVSGWDQSILCDQLEQHGFSVIAVESSKVFCVEPKKSGLRVSVQEADELLVLEADQVLWGNCPTEYKGWRGLYDHEALGHEKAIETVLKGSGSVTYQNYVKYDASLCLYHGKRKAICGQCADICPTQAIKRKDQSFQLCISHIECIGCGACVAGCPTGAIDSARMPREAFARIRTLYKEQIAMILPSKLDFDLLQVDLDENVLPLVLEDEFMLDEWHLISFLQTNGLPLIFYYTGTLSPVTKNVFSVVNGIYQKIYQRKAVLVCQDTEELLAAFDNLTPFTEAIYDPDERSLPKKPIMAKRLKHIVGNGDFGTVFTGPYLHYGMLRLNQDKCTLCLSCVGGCNSGALSAHAENNTLQFTPSLCMCCDYCVQTCPEENCLETLKDQLVMHPEFFRQRVIAQDEIFNCIECGKGFAPAKSIARIATIMKPNFGDDSTRIKTLYCCPDCKAKVMLEALKSEPM